MIKNFLTTFFEKNNIEINVTKENTQELCYCEKTSRVTDEKYILEVTTKDGKTSVNIRCSGEKSEFYALCDIAQRAEN